MINIANNKKIKSKDERISDEIKKLKVLYKDLPKDKFVIVDGLINRAAYMKITLEDFEKELDEKGYVELFSQSEKTEPYERKRPTAEMYNSMSKNYSVIMKQLNDLLPEDIKSNSEDDFYKFALSVGQK